MDSDEAVAEIGVEEFEVVMDDEALMALKAEPREAISDAVEHIESGPGFPAFSGAAHEEDFALAQETIDDDRRERIWH
jgi:hypothetical protein